MSGVVLPSPSPPTTSGAVAATAANAMVDTTATASSLPLPARTAAAATAPAAANNAYMLSSNMSFPQYPANLLSNASYYDAQHSQSHWLNPRLYSSPFATTAATTAATAAATAFDPTAAAYGLKNYPRPIEYTYHMYSTIPYMVSRKYTRAIKKMYISHQ